MLRTRKTRIVMLVSAALIGTVVLLFALATLHARSDRREAAEQRFRNEATVTAAVIESAFGSSSASVQQAYGEEFGGGPITPGGLDRIVRQGQLSYALVLSPKGAVLGTSSGLDPAVAAAIDEQPAHVAAVIAGAPWQLSGVVRGRTAEYAASYKSSAGRRIIVQGFPLKLISGFIGGTLSQLPNAEREVAYVIDDTGQVIASADASVEVSGPAPIVTGDREQTSAAIGNTAWNVVLSATAASLYDGVFNPAQWLVLVALAIAGIVALYLLGRAMQTTQKLEAAYAELERSNADLARTNVELQRSNGELEQFASVASHDLQEPLRKVQTFGDQLQRRYAHQLDDEANDYLQRMRNASARMSTLIDDLLRFSRVTTHAKPHVAVDLNRIAHDVLLDLETRVAETGGTVELGDLPVVQADPTQMRQLLQNLIGNALKFHRPGVPPVVRIGTAGPADPGRVALTVSDNGIGFEAVYGERIFQVFERLHPRDVYAGTGIGLALCRKIAERHDGTITAESRPGAGSTFTVVLPAAPVPAPTGTQEHAHV